MFYTYLHRRNDTGQVFYVGKGKGNRSTWEYGRGQYWQNIVKKHGFTAEIVAHWTSESDAFEHECFLIKVFREMGFDLANATSGGEGPAGWKASDATKAKQSAAAKARVATPATREKLSAALRKRHAAPGASDLLSARAKATNARPEVKSKISAASKARWATAEYRQKRSTAMAPIFASQEYRDKISVAGIEANKIPGVKERRVASVALWYEQPGNRERHGAARKVANNKPETLALISAAMRESHKRPEVKKKISDVSLAAWRDPVARAKRCKRVLCVETGIEYASQVAAANAIGARQGDISTSCLRGWGVRGMHFKFANADRLPESTEDSSLAPTPT